MKRLILTLSIMLTMVFAGTASADHEGLGIGLVSGDTNGLTLKFMTTERSGVDLSAGVGVFGDLARLRVDWEFDFASIEGRNLRIPFYIGLGVFAESQNGDNVLDLGIRAPLGVGFQFQNTPIEVYVQTGLESTFIDSNNNVIVFAPSAALGIRLYTR